MKGSLMLGALCAVGALAGPVDKRAMVTDIELTVVTVTVTKPAVAAPTPASAGNAASPPEIANAAHKNHEDQQQDQQGQQDFSWPPWPTTTEAPLPTSVVPSSTVAPPTTTSSSSSSSSVAPPTSTGTAYQNMILDSHNVHRANHSASALTWDDDLAASALALANTCDYHHDTSMGPASNYGQNIAYGVGESEVNKIITDMMYNDEMMYFQDLYGQADPDMTYFEHWGHFTQIVWASTNSVGCATVTCQPLAGASSSDPLPFTVCNYYPAGNYAGEYADNVLKPLGQPMLVV